MNLPNSIFSLGEQPCRTFQPKRDGNQYAEWDNRHVCVFCSDGQVSFCEACYKDHHGYGYENCKRLVSEEVEQAIADLCIVRADAECEAEMQTARAAGLEQENSRLKGRIEAEAQSGMQSLRTQENLFGAKLDALQAQLETAEGLLRDAEDVAMHRRGCPDYRDACECGYADWWDKKEAYFRAKEGK